MIHLSQSSSFPSQFTTHPRTLNLNWTICDHSSPKSNYSVHKSSKDCLVKFKCAAMSWDLITISEQGKIWLKARNFPNRRILRRIQLEFASTLQELRRSPQQPSITIHVNYTQHQYQLQRAFIGMSLVVTCKWIRIMWTLGSNLEGAFCSIDTTTPTVWCLEDSIRKSTIH